MRLWHTTATDKHHFYDFQWPIYFHCVNCTQATVHNKLHNGGMH